nr:diguanylate cyclase [Oceanospirillum multiglobuliferum]
MNATVSVSIGCATALPSQQQSSSNTQDSLVFRADQALYQAKNKGRNQVVAASSS